MNNLNHTEQLRKLQETIKKNQESVTKNQTDLKPESEDPLEVKKLNESKYTAEFV